ncbi:hypothetical protein [Kitasatospora sp. LaBMicrA B282]|uniref:hypothetical protein n=1 Tax=Kitasatospora sp. LaBMicrA B282 TaxID=3420949 RepID=UPI003D11D7AD
MVRRSGQARNLVVGEETFRWTVGHAHDVDESRVVGRYQDCREILTLRRRGAAGRVWLVFRDGPGRLVPDGILHSGAVGTTGGDWLNLHEPGTARALLDQVRADGWDPGDPRTRHLDGWPLFDAVVARRSAGTARP